MTDYIHNINRLPDLWDYLNNNKNVADVVRKTLTLLSPDKYKELNNEDTEEEIIPEREYNVVLHFFLNGPEFVRYEQLELDEYPDVEKDCADWVIVFHPEPGAHCTGKIYYWMLKDENDEIDAEAEEKLACTIFNIETYTNESAIKMVLAAFITMMTSADKFETEIWDQLAE